MKNLLTIILVIGSSSIGRSQQDTLIKQLAGVDVSQDSLEAYVNPNLSVLNSIETKAHILSTDILQNFYLADSSELIKYDREGNLLYRFSNNRYGQLTWLEASDPFHTQLFFEEFQRLILLDNTLSEISNYNLQDFGYYQSSAVTLSYDNNLWIFDAISGELRKVDRKGKILFASDNLFYQFEEEPEPLRLLESKQHVLLLDKKQGFFLFDIFGKYLKKLDLPITSNFQLRRELLIYEHGGSLYLFNLENLSTTELMPNRNPENGLRNLRLESNLLYQLNEEGMEILEVKN